MISVEGPRRSKTASPKSVARAGYLEEEYLVSGTADLYGYDGSFHTVPVTPEVPFVTRLLVRRPSDDAAASGDVLLEPLHPSADMASAWPRLGNALLSAGWSWVGVTQHPMGLAATKASDPQYTDLDVPDPGLGFDIVAQVAVWLRANGLPGLHLDHLFMSGASHTGTFQRVFLGDGFHARARRGGGGPAVEGYLIQISSGAFMLGGYHALHQDGPVPPAGDRRRVIQPFDVPVIELLSEGEAETNRDSRRPERRARRPVPALRGPRGCPHDQARPGQRGTARHGRGAVGLPHATVGGRGAAQPAAVGGGRRRSAAGRSPDEPCEQGGRPGGWAR
jgi:hypothetical protein